MSIRIHTSLSYLPDSVPPHEFLYLFKSHLGITSWSESRLDQLFGADHASDAMLIFSDLSSADISLLPFDYRFALDNPEAAAQAARFIKDAEIKGKPVLGFLMSDHSEPILVPNLCLFRTSCIRSKLSAMEYCMPPFIDDLLKDNKALPVVALRKSERPSLAFMGFARQPMDNISRLRARVNKWRGRESGHDLRSRLLSELGKDRQLDTTFVIRNKFWGGVFDDQGAIISTTTKRVIQHEYAANIFESLYTLCIRGSGNYSIRLFETISCGRIPVFVDTDCVLPLEDIIDWNKHCIHVNTLTGTAISSAIFEFHHQHSNVALEHIQLANRSTWETHLTPIAFFLHSVRKALSLNRSNIR